MLSPKWNTYITPSKVKGHLRRTLKFEDGELCCKRMSSGHNVVIVLTNSQHLLLFIQDLHRIDPEGIHH